MRVLGKEGRLSRTNLNPPPQRKPDVHDFLRARRAACGCEQEADRVGRCVEVVIWLLRRAGSLMGDVSFAENALQTSSGSEGIDRRGRRCR